MEQEPLNADGDASRGQSAVDELPRIFFLGERLAADTTLAFRAHHFTGGNSRAANDAAARGLVIFKKLMTALVIVEMALSAVA